MGLNIKNKLGFAPRLRQHLTASGAVGIPWGTPVDSAKATKELPSALTDLIDVGDTVEFEGNTYEKVVAATTDTNEFEDAEGLAELLDDLYHWDAGESSDAVTVTASVGGVRFNGREIKITKLEDTTDNGTATSEATAEIDDTTTAQMANGDIIWFYGRIYTKAAATDVSEREFENAAGLIDCIDAAPEWGAADTSGEIEITAAAAGEEWNDEDVIVIFFRETASGVDGTEAYGPGAIMADANRIYVCVDGGPKSDVEWKQIPVALASL